MADLELVGLHTDGEHLVLVGPDGHRHRIAIDDALRAAVRNDRPRLGQVRTASLVRPREIQTRIRAGESPADIARDAGVPVEQVQRYESPVIAERTWVAEQARLITLGREHGAPRLGDLVVDRLAHRGVDPADLTWTAVRRPGEDWELVLGFRAGERDREARWHVDIPTRTLHALDDESRWLSETDLGAPDSRRHLSSIQSRVYDVEVDTDVPAPHAEQSPHWASSRPRRTERPYDTHAPAGREREAEAEAEGSAPGRSPAGYGRADHADGPPSDDAGDAASRTPIGIPAPDAGTAADAPTSALDAAPTSATGASDEGLREEADRRTAELLEGLRASRGVRQEIGRLEEEDEDDGQWGGTPADRAQATPEAERPPATVRQLRPTPAPTPAATPEASGSGTGTLAESDQVTESRGGAGTGRPEHAPAGGTDTRQAPAGGTDTRQAPAPAGGTETQQAPALEPGRTPAPNPEKPAGASRAAGRPDPGKRAPASAGKARPPASSARRPVEGRAPAAGKAAEPSSQTGQAKPRTEVVGPPVADDGAEEQATATLSPVLPPGEPTRRPKSKSRRTSVPSWDEIVFGAKPE